MKTMKQTAFVTLLFLVLAFTAQAQNLLTNGDFSNDDAWLVYPQHGPVTIGSHENGRDAKYNPVGDGEVWHLQLYQEIEVRAGQEYFFSFDARATSGSIRDLDFAVEYHTAPYNRHLTETVGLTSEWQNFSGSFVAQITQRVKVVFMDARDGTPCYIDNVVVSTERSRLSIEYDNNGTGGTISGPPIVEYEAYVELTADAEPGYQFLRYEIMAGVGVVTPNGIAEVTTDIMVRGVFEPAHNTVHYSEIRGTIEGPGSYRTESSFLIDLFADEGYRYENLSIQSTGPVPRYTCEPVDAITQCRVYGTYGNLIIEAQFVPHDYLIHYDLSPEGSITGPEMYTANTRFYIHVLPRAGYSFDRLEIRSIEGPTPEYECISARTCSIEGITGSLFITPHFIPVAPTEYSVAYASNTLGGISGPTSYMENATFTVTATPNTGYEFNGISISSSLVRPEYTCADGPGVVECTIFAAIGHLTINANFREIPSLEYTITYTVEGNGDFSGPATITHGSSAELTAIPGPGSFLSNIIVTSGNAFINGTVVSEVTSDIALRAVFLEENNEVVLDSFIDWRDGRSYTTVHIGQQLWMAENLKIETPDMPDKSTCYNNQNRICDEYGRLYHLNAAWVVCPEDWHVPSEAEWTQLLSVVGTESGSKLKSTYGWRRGNGSDSFNFNGQSMGKAWQFESVWHFEQAGLQSVYWASDYEANVSRALELLADSDEAAMINTDNETNYHYVRCVHD
ncbi:MAG: carbohydrate binding domain-containing protein [Fibrobacterales bacterium]